MTPKEKAEDMRMKFYKESLCTIAGTATIFWEQSKHLASLCADELIAAAQEDCDAFVVTLQYWQQVKIEIEKL